jgi:RimJ/RimL family protein N-acetyltransferase
LSGVAFVPAGFRVPERLEAEDFVLEPLGLEHNERDHAAWSSSKEHIHATPGWTESASWPSEMTLEENLRDLERHRDDFRERRGFTYTVLDRGSGDVVGCVYIYPLPDSDYDARVLSWVRADRADLDVPLWRAVSAWVESEWPFEQVEYAARV